MSKKRVSEMTDDEIRAMAGVRTPDMAANRVHAMTDTQRYDFLLRLAGYNPGLLIDLLDEIGPNRSHDGVWPPPKLLR